MFKFSTMMLLIGMAVTGMGCAAAVPEDSPLSRNWGRSYETAVYLQTANPDAGDNLEPIEGMSGTASANVVEGYEQSFKANQGKETVNVWKLGQ